MTGRIMQPGMKMNNLGSVEVAETGGGFFGFISDHRRVINIALTLLGLVVIVLYYYCGSSCLYLAGNVLGVDLKLWGVAFLWLLTMLVLFRMHTFCCFLVSVGLGGEIFLVGYQIFHRTYCPFCLILALIVFALFVMNLNKKKLTLILLSVALGLVFLSAFFQSVPLKIETGVRALPSFGRGDIKVRLYTDYFCGPCRAVEPEAENLLYELARKDRINLTFIDMPIHRPTPVYTAYYLFLSQRERGLDRILRIREVLFQAAEKKIEDSRALQDYLHRAGFDVQRMDEKTGAADIAKYLLEDQVGGTPTLIVVQGNKKMKYFGRAEVIKGLQSLR